MSRPLTTVFEIRTAGADSQGGAFDSASAGTDYSQQDSPQLTITDVVTLGTGTVTSVAGGFTAAMVGNDINIAGTPYRITARTNTNTITVDGSPGAATGQTGKIGGAYGSLGFVAGIATSSSKIHVKGGTYTVSTTTPNVSGGPLDWFAGTPSGDGADSAVQINGYQTVRLDDGTQPVIQIASSGVTSISVFKIGPRVIIRNIEVDGQSKTGIRGIYFGYTDGCVYRCTIRNCTDNGIMLGAKQSAVRCRVTNCSGDGAFVLGADQGCTVVACVADNNGTYGFAGGGSAVIGCISVANTGIGFDVQGHGSTVCNCTSYGNSGSGFQSWSGTQGAAKFVNCVSYGNGAYGFSEGGTVAMLINVFTGSNTSGAYLAWVTSAGNGFRPTQIIGQTALSGNPFVNPSGTISSIEDAWTFFALNNTAGAGAVCRAAGMIPYADAGAVQHQDSGGSTIEISTVLAHVGRGGAAVGY